MEAINGVRKENVNIILCVLNVYEPVVYSLENSAKAFENFVKTLDYTEKTKRDAKYPSYKTHKMYPGLEWLQSRVDKIGIIKTGQEIESNSARGTAYLYFLALIGLLNVQFNDYFYTNPKTILKLDSWLKPYKEALGIVEFVDELLKIAESTQNRQINQVRQAKFGNKVSIYLLLRYKLTHIRELQFEQWQEFMMECRNSHRHIQNASISLIHRTLLHMRILDMPYARKLSGAISLEKERKWCSHPMIAPYYDAFISFVSQSKAQGTCRQYRKAIEVFFNYIFDKKGNDFRLSQLTRSDITAFITYLYSGRNRQGNPCSLKFIESKSYCIKVFLRFVSENAVDFKRNGFPAFSNKIIIDQDFEIKQINYLPKPVAEDVLNILMETLSRVQNVKYRLVFLLMLTTGLAKSDMLNLKYNCIKYEESKDIYLLSYYRLKSKKHVIVQALPDAVPIILELQGMNTQEILFPHPDGSASIFLLNDGGNILKSMWLTYWMKKHIEAAVNQAPQLACDIKRLTLHRLRHTFASIMRDRGATITQLMELMGHSSISVTQKYTKESDRLKIELIEKLQSGEFICESIQSMDQPVLQGEQGAAFIESMIRHENRFVGGRCTVNGYDNCKNAFRCLTCIYLCTTKEDMREIISVMRIQHLQCQELRARLAKETNDRAVKSVENDLKRIKDSLKVVFDKYRKLQGVIVNKEQQVVFKSIVPNYTEKTGFITFV